MFCIYLVCTVSHFIVCCFLTDIHEQVPVGYHLHIYHSVINSICHILSSQSHVICTHYHHSHTSFGHIVISHMSFDTLSSQSHVIWHTVITLTRHLYTLSSQSHVICTRYHHSHTSFGHTVISHMSFDTLSSQSHVNWHTVITLTRHLYTLSSQSHENCKLQSFICISELWQVSKIGNGHASMFIK
jgi:hypothetical protein